MGGAEVGAAGSGVVPVRTSLEQDGGIPRAVTERLTTLSATRASGHATGSHPHLASRRGAGWGGRGLEGGVVRGGQRVVGGPAFLAPELLRNESGPSKEGDVYAFGIVIYEGTTSVVRAHTP